MKECREQMLGNMMNAFAEGYRLGLQYGEKVLNNRRKIEVKYIDSGDCKIEFAKLNNGVLRSYGRMMPF